jgi:hypothetical protein
VSGRVRKGRHRAEGVKVGSPLPPTTLSNRSYRGGSGGAVPHAASALPPVEHQAALAARPARAGGARRPGAGLGGPSAKAGMPPRPGPRLGSASAPIGAVPPPPLRHFSIGATGGGSGGAVPHAASALPPVEHQAAFAARPPARAGGARRPSAGSGGAIGQDGHAPPLRPPPRPIAALGI